MIKKLFKNVERKSNLLDLMHFDLCEFNSMLTRGGNLYFITFIDDCSRFTNDYLLKHKDGAFNVFKIYMEKRGSDDFIVMSDDCMHMPASDMCYVICLTKLACLSL